MNIKNNRWLWLEKLENAVPRSGYGNRLSMYLIALEAWRRGLQVKFYYLDNQDNKMLIRYSLSNVDKEHFFESSMGDKLTRKAISICENKDETKKYLSLAGIPVPEGKRFDEKRADDEILSYAKSLGYPIVLKPIAGNAGLGVFANIKSEESLKKYLEHVRYELGLKDIIVEQYIPGIEYRIFLVNGEIIGAVNRIPANIIGNGKNTIKELIDQKNRNRNRNPNLSSKSIIVDKEIEDMVNQSGYRLNSIPLKGQRIFLRNKSNVSMGGDPIDVTDQLTSELKEIAINAMKSIPGLDVCGLDMIVDPNTNSGTVIEINTKPMIGLHVFPVKGKSRDAAKAIVDYYFPETVGKEKSNLYFDFNAAIAPIRNRISNYTILLPPPITSKMIGIKICMSVDNKENIDFAAEVRLEALKREIHGYIKEITNDIYEIVLVSSNETTINNFKNMCLYHVNGIKVNNMNETRWTKPVKVGFEIKRHSKTKRNSNRKLRQNLLKLRAENKELKEKILLLENSLEKISSKCNKQQIKNKRLSEQILLLNNEIKEAQQKHNEILNSKSWRYTKLFRRVSKVLRNIIKR